MNVLFDRIYADLYTHLYPPALSSTLFSFMWILCEFIEKERCQIQDPASRIAFVLVRFGCVSNCMGFPTGCIIALIEIDKRCKYFL